MTGQATMRSPRVSYSIEEGCNDVVAQDSGVGVSVGSTRGVLAVVPQAQLSSVLVCHAERSALRAGCSSSCKRSLVCCCRCFVLGSGTLYSPTTSYDFSAQWAAIDKKKRASEWGTRHECDPCGDVSRRGGFNAAGRKVASFSRHT